MHRARFTADRLADLDEPVRRSFSHPISKGDTARSALPSLASVGWWFDTPRYTPFFKAHIHAVRQC